MHTIFLVLLVVAAVVAANAVYARFNAVPVAFLQIAAGLLLALTPLYRDFELEPEVFLLAIISVLMFNDGQNTSIRKLTRQLGTTLSLAVVLAIITILVVGTVTHFLIPQFSLALALALGAIITPTDAVAVSSITTNMAVPEKVMETLENESLFNDASGIVAFNLAIAAVITGKFSVTAGVQNFLYVFIGGIILGLILGYLIVRVRIALINRRVDTPSVIVPYTLLTPFAVYLIAEAFGVSGILAVVATGLIHGIQQGRLRLTTSRLQIVMSTTWSIVASILNGIVFVLLGVSLPSVIIHLQQRDTGSVLILVGLGVLLYAVMTFVRFLWCRMDMAKVAAENRQEQTKNSLILALSGVHGTITLAMAFSLPLTLGGHSFTYRNDIIFIASVVILTSLLVPTLILPRILPKQVSQVTEAQLAQAKTAMVDDAIKMIQDRHGTSPNANAVMMILAGQRPVEAAPNKAKLDALFDAAYQIEQKTINEMYQAGTISAQMLNWYLRVARTTNLQNQQSFRQRLSFFIRFIVVSKISLDKAARQRRHEFRLLRRQQQSLARDKMAEIKRRSWTQLKEIEQKPYDAVIAYLIDSYTPENETEISLVRRAYEERHRRLSGTKADQEAQNELLIEAFQQEHNFIQNQAAVKNYNRALSNELYEQISTDQLVYMQSVNAD
ncbi:Na+/H+ antiporter [Agrilactobacillus yilanensis]|uniref:Na+/H+ antiporter n=1 Tax=Agrilactobacillus yilanensis TaxID=2485997 RepID=A0ABW4J4E9_9LACO|nr:Na+/H+ antiporter [Agrilactobacillus yilanensis]